MQFNIFSELPCAVLVADEQERIVTGNPNLIALVCDTENKGLPEYMDCLFTRASSIFCQTHVWPLLRHESEVHEIFLHLRRPCGAPLPVMTNAKKMMIKGQTNYIWLFFLAQERSRFESELLEARKRSEQLASQLTDAHKRLHALNAQLKARMVATEDENRSLTILTFTDSLTGLGNRRALEAAAEKLAQTPTSIFSILMIDIDHFKAVNDNYGHDRGDDVLRDLGQCLQAVARSSDTVVRYGGEEFALVLPKSDVAQSRRIAERIHEIIAAEKPGGISLSVSIGVATANIGQTGDLLATLKLADEAVYAAKHQGRNRTVHRNDLKDSPD
jgi:sigma-B regulation protein RsbU (phosphoserine phosphatase)